MRYLNAVEADPAAVAVRIEENTLTVDLADGRTLSVPLEWYPRLFHGTDEERRNVQILGNGYAIEWPDLEEHIGVESLLAGRRSGESATSLQQWLAARNGGH